MAEPRPRNKTARQLAEEEEADWEEDIEAGEEAEPMPVAPSNQSRSLKWSRSRWPLHRRHLLIRAEPVAAPEPAPTADPVQEASTTTMEVEVAEEEATLTEDEIDAKVQAFGEYDPTLDLSRFELPNIDLLAAHGSGKTEVSPEELEANKKRIEDTLENYGIKIASIKASIGPTVTLYELVPAPGVRISKIKNLEDDIALSLAALGIRIIAPIPGQGTIGIEVPNSNPDVVSMRSLIASDKFQNSDAALPIAIGKTISNETYVFDLAKMPHMLMAGATGQGKSVGLNAMLVSLLYKKHPSQLKFVWSTRRRWN